MIEDLIPCIIQIESSGNPNAISPIGARGLMQIMPIVLEEYNTKNIKDDKIVDLDIPTIGYFSQENLFVPSINRQIGTWYLRRLKDHYLFIDGKDYYTVERLLASYNGGPTRMRRLLRQGKDWQDMPDESVNYVKKVLRCYK